MDNLGAHMSIAGGLPNALHRGRELRCSVVQIFLKNQVQWAGRAVAADEVAEFKRVKDATGIDPVFAHATYLINLAAPDEMEWRRALDAFHDELERAEALALPFVVIHPGSHKGAGLEAGLARVGQALDELHRRTAGYGVRIALENTAGAGNLLGARAEDLAGILGRVREPERVAVCLDTCHLFAAGYDIRTAGGLAVTLARFDAAVGLDRIVAFHLNDAKAGLGYRSGPPPAHRARGDRPGGVRRLLAHPRLGRRPMALETPKEDGWDTEESRDAPAPSPGAPPGRPAPLTPAAAAARILAFGRARLGERGEYANVASAVGVAQYIAVAGEVARALGRGRVLDWGAGWDRPACSSTPVDLRSWPTTSRTRARQRGCWRGRASPTSSTPGPRSRSPTGRSTASSTAACSSTSTTSGRRWPSCAGS